MPKSVSDFHKRRAKVGKKVQRSNVTQINVKSRKISLLEQKIGKAANVNADSRGEVNRLISGLQHHSVSSRKQSLNLLF